MSILRKLAVFIEKPPETSSNCYETIKKCLKTDKTWLHHSLCNGMLNRKFPVTMATGDVPKFPKITILHCLFFSFKVLKLLNELR
jgi:hypothetical protein